ncbi:MAG: hypothetical protein EBS91_06570 [Betaproteobacteria bacterium]|nr:hypothetical protein [Betaproteobacteria bacterium]
MQLDFDGGASNDASRAALEQQLGFTLPVESLRYWMLGVPDPHSLVEERIATDAIRWVLRSESAIARPAASSLALLMR